MTTSVEGFSALDPVIQHHIVNTLRWPDLRPLQKASVASLLAGHDALLLAPTAGGKTEAAFFPVLTRAEREQWTGTSVLYVAPLKALLNNVESRAMEYTSWLGRSASVRHGDTTQAERRRQGTERPDVLMTTPESLESMLISPTVNVTDFFSELRTIIVDEVHAFAGDDRGWHLLSVLERLSAVVRRPIQRIGLSATVGNPEELLTWLQGGNAAAGLPASVIAPPVDRTGAAAPELRLDFVGSEDNAATVISRLHGGEKRLVFAESRRTVELLGNALHERDVTTFLSHSSLSLSERRRSEQAFAEAQDCVIISTSTLELGIDVGDLDRVLQLGAPSTVASFLQRLGRTGRRPGAQRNMLFLELKPADLLRAAGLLLLHGEGYVEPIQPPPAPHHIVAQQILALTLQKGQLQRGAALAGLQALGMSDSTTYRTIEDGLLEHGHLDSDGGLLFVGPETQRRYGGLYFRDLMAVFTVEAEFPVFHGRTEIGSVAPNWIATDPDDQPLLILAGRSWKVSFIDWKRHLVHVEPSDRGLAPRWASPPRALSWALSDAMRRVLLGADPAGVVLTGRAQDALADHREAERYTVAADHTVLASTADDLRWWTWGGAGANALLVAALEQVAPELLGEKLRFDNFSLRLRGDVDAASLGRALRQATSNFGGDLAGVDPLVDDAAVRGLKFHEMLPLDLARATLAARLADHAGVARVLERPVQMLRTAEDGRMWG